MTTAVFQKWYDVTIAVFISGYAQRNANWLFNYGSLWPCTSGTKLFNTGGGGTSGIVGGWCDVFSKQDSVYAGQTSYNDWGDVTPVTAVGNLNPTYWNGRVRGTSFVKSNANPFPTTVYGYDYPITLNANTSYPSSLGALPSNINPITIDSLNNPIIPAFQFGSSVAMADFDRVNNFYIPSGAVDMFDTTGLKTHINGNSARQVSGIVPAQNIALYNNGSVDCTVSLTPTVGTPNVITWDNSAVNTTLQDAGVAGTGLQRSTISPYGFLSFLKGDFTLGARLVHNPMILTSFDGLKYWGIAMAAGDSFATTALSDVSGSGRTGQITADGLFWFQNSAPATCQDKVFVGAISLVSKPRRWLAEMGPVYQ